jgi:CPA2 family monovalent cation:H+ antiporter-2
LIARGEFSIAVAGLAVASNVEPEVGPLAVSYVFLLAVVGPIAARLAEAPADKRASVRLG